MYQLTLLLIFIAALCTSRAALAQDSAPEKPGVQELLLKDGRKVTILWDSFKVQNVRLYMKGDTAFINNERLTDQPLVVRKVIQWAAEEQGIPGDVEQHMKDSIKQPMKLRIVGANPLVLKLPYATGVNINTGTPMSLPLCAVDPADQRLMWDAANKMQVYDQYVARDRRKVFAAEEAASAARQAAWAADETADNTRKILDTLRY